MNDLITIIVPVYNVKPYLRQCLDSIIGQTYNNLEILVVDAGSTDGSGLICDEYADRDDRIRVFHKENRDLSSARNMGLDHASGDWIGFVDSDDWILPGMFDAMYRAAKDGDAEISVCGLTFVWPDKTEDWTVRDEQPVLNGNARIAEAFLGDDRLRTSACNKLYRKSDFENVRFPPERYYEDIPVVTELMLKAKRVALLDQCFYMYRQRDDSIIHTGTVEICIDRWTGHKERFDRYAERYPRVRSRLLYECMKAIVLAWRSLPVGLDVGKEEKERFLEMRDYARAHFAEAMNGKYPLSFMISGWLTRWYSPWSVSVIRIAFSLRDFMRNHGITNVRKQLQGNR